MGLPEGIPACRTSLAQDKVQNQGAQAAGFWKDVQLRKEKERLTGLVNAESALRPANEEIVTQSPLPIDAILPDVAAALAGNRAW